MSPVVSCPACGRELRVDSRVDRAPVPCAGCGIVLTALQTPQGLRLLLPPGARAAGKAAVASPSGPVLKPVTPASRATSPTTGSGGTPRLPKKTGGWRAAASKPAVVGVAAIVMLLAAMACWWYAKQPDSILANQENLKSPATASPDAANASTGKLPATEPKSAAGQSGTPPSSGTPAPPPQRVVLSTRELIRLVEPSVCRIRTRNSIGSGFVVGPNLICTNEHVVGLEDEAGWVVEFPAHDGRQFSRVTLAYAADGLDLALLRVANLPDDFRPITVGTRAQLQKGDRLVVIGSPGGLENVVTEGIVGSFQEIKSQTFIQLSVTVNPGNSGGPALNEFGEVAGVVTLKAEQEGIGMAIPGDEVQRAIKELARLPADESRRLQTRWKSRQAGTKLLVGIREGLELLVVPPDARSTAKSVEAWQRVYRDGPAMSQRLREDLLEKEKHGLFVRLEQLFQETDTAVEAAGTDSAALKLLYERLAAQADVLEGELKSTCGLAETSRRRAVPIRGGK